MIGEVHFGDCRESLRRMAKAGVKAQTCVTSPPYFGLRDYGHDGQIGQEQTPDEYVANLVEVFRAVRDVLADDGTLWVNIGDSWASQGGKEPPQTKWNRPGIHDGQNGGKSRKPPTGYKAKDLIGIPWLLAFALRSDGWWLRQEIIWQKPNAMPESSAKDRFTKSHEHLFLLSKKQRYFFDHEAVKELAADGSKRARRSVLSVNTRGYKGAHFAVYPPELITPCILAGSRVGDVVLDPFMGSGTTAAVAIEHGRQFIGCELNPAYKELQDERIASARRLIAGHDESTDLATRQIDLFEKEAA